MTPLRSLMFCNGIVTFTIEEFHKLKWVETDVVVEKE